MKELLDSLDLLEAGVGDEPPSVFIPSSRACGGDDGECFVLVETRNIACLKETSFVKTSGGHRVPVPCVEKRCARCGEVLLPGTSCQRETWVDRIAGQFYHRYVCYNC
jgi:hypothetical protein